MIYINKDTSVNFKSYIKKNYIYRNEKIKIYKKKQMTLRFKKNENSVVRIRV